MCTSSLCTLIVACGWMLPRGVDWTGLPRKKSVKRFKSSGGSDTFHNYLLYIVYICSSRWRVVCKNHLVNYRKLTVWSKALQGLLAHFTSIHQWLFYLHNFLLHFSSITSLTYGTWVRGSTGSWRQRPGPRDAKICFCGFEACPTTCGGVAPQAMAMHSCSSKFQAWCVFMFRHKRDVTPRCPINM